MRKLLLALIGVVIAIPSYADLGNISVKSYLNQNLDAVIPINEKPSSIDFDSFRIELANNSKFKEYGISYNPELGNLRFRIVHNAQKAYLLVTSSKPISSPVLSFLLHYKLNDNDYYRQYTVLLDPIDYTNNNYNQTKANTSPNKLIIVKNSQVSTKKTQPIPIHSNIKNKSNSIPQAPKAIELYKLDLSNPYIKDHLSNFNQESMLYTTNKGDVLYDIVKFNQLLYPLAKLDVNQVIIAIGLKNYHNLYDYSHQYESGVNIRLVRALDIKLIPEDMANEYLWDSSLNKDQRLNLLRQMANKFDPLLDIESTELFIQPLKNTKPNKNIVKNISLSKSSTHIKSENLFLMFIKDFKWLILGALISVIIFIFYRKKKKSNSSGFGLINPKADSSKFEANSDWNTTLSLNESFRQSLSKDNNIIQSNLEENQGYKHFDPKPEISTNKPQTILSAPSEVEVTKVIENEVVESKQNINIRQDQVVKAKLVKVDEDLIETLKQILSFDDSRDDIRYKLLEIYLGAGLTEFAAPLYQELNSRLDSDDGIRKNISMLCSRLGVNENSLHAGSEAEQAAQNSQTKIAYINNNPNDSNTPQSEGTSQAYEPDTIGSISTDPVDSNPETKRILDFVSPSIGVIAEQVEKPIDFSETRVMDFNLYKPAGSMVDTLEKDEEEVTAPTVAEDSIHNSLDFISFDSSTKPFVSDDVMPLQELANDYEEKLNLAKMYYHIEEITKAKEILNKLIADPSVPAQVSQQAQQLKLDFGLND